MYPGNTQIKARIEALLGDSKRGGLGFTILTGAEEKLSPGIDLPAAEVSLGPWSSSPLGFTGPLAIARTFEILLLVASAAPTSAWKDKQAALDAAEPYLQDVVQWFWAHNSLELNSPPLVDCQPMSGEGPIFTPYKGGDWVAIVFRLPTT